jgi:hypothetical protein
MARKAVGLATNGRPESVRLCGFHRPGGLRGTPENVRDSSPSAGRRRTRDARTTTLPVRRPAGRGRGQVFPQRNRTPGRLGDVARALLPAARSRGRCTAESALLRERVWRRVLAATYSGHPIGARGWGSGEGSEQAESVMQEPWPLDACPDVRARHLLCRDDGFFPADLPEWSPGNAWAPPQMRSRAATPSPSAARKYLPTDSRCAARSGRSQPASGFAREQRHQLPLRRPTWFPRG